jgi:hypothetical protein
VKFGKDNNNNKNNNRNNKNSLFKHPEWMWMRERCCVDCECFCSK